MGDSAKKPYEAVLDCVASHAELPKLVNFARAYFEKVMGSQADSMLLFNLELVVSEVCTNVVKYAYAKENPGPVRLELNASSGNVRIRVSDRGLPFNPCLAPDPDLDNPKSSGLGIFFLRELMDTLEYHRNADENVLVLSKTF